MARREPSWPNQNNTVWALAEVEPPATAALLWTVPVPSEFSTLDADIHRHPRPDHRSRRTYPQPQERRRHAAPTIARRHDRRQRLGQVVARLRHDLRRRASAATSSRSSAYARQFLERMEKPDIDSIEGICPAIAIRQKNSIRNPRSTVGTTTEIHDYLRLLYARVGRTFCRSCGKEVIRETPEVVATRLSALPAGTRLLIGFDMPVVASAPMVTPGVDADEDEDASATTSRRRPRTPQPVLPDLVDPDRGDARGASAQGLRPSLPRRPDRERSTTWIRRGSGIGRRSR